MSHDASGQQPSAADQVAESVLTDQGLDFSTAARARGWTNATWLADGVVVRVARTAGPADLLREVRLARLLPAPVGYPHVVDAGVRDGHEWVVTRRIAAENMEDAWPALDWQQRTTAMEQVWARAEHIHRIDVTEAAPYARRRSPFFAESAEQAMALLARLAAAGLLTRHQVAVLEEALDRFWLALPDTPSVLNHGDLGTCNVLWNDGHVVALLDFEFAVIGPVEIDLNEILKFAFTAPDGDATSDRLGYRRAMQDAAIRIARPVLDRSGGTDVLLGYSILLEAWGTENELAADDVGDPADVEPYRLLVALADGDGGHLAPVLEARQP